MTTRSAADRVLSELEIFGTRLGLETTRAVLSAVGDPQRRFAAVLVAGTNGKGSVATLLSSIGSAAGYRTGVFTSPHLETVTERIRLDGRSIAEDRLGELLVAVCETAVAVTGAPATYFESLFIAACQWFAEMDAELVIFEVGLGGRLDATNVTDPELSVITEIGLEHREQLGDTVEAIAREKAGIMRPGRPVVVGALDQVAVSELERSARSVDADWIWAPGIIEIASKTEHRDWSKHVVIESLTERYETRFWLAGDHQEQNLSTAIAAAEELRRRGWQRIDRQSVEEGVAACRWPGRLERIELADAPLFVLDAAHNPDAAKALAAFLEHRLHGYCLLFGVLGDKDVGQILPPLTRGAGRVVLTRPRSSRGRDPHSLADLVDSAVEVIVEVDPVAALERVLAGDLAVVVCGSIYLVGEVRSRLRRLLTAGDQS